METPGQFWVEINIPLPEINLTGDQAIWRGWSTNIGSRQRLVAALDAATHQLPFEVCLRQIAAKQIASEVEAMSNHQRLEFEATIRADGL